MNTSKEAVDTPKKTANFLAIDITTGELALAVRDDNGNEDYAAVKMRGGASWNDDEEFPGFDLAEVPKMIDDLIKALEKKEWSFDRKGEQQPGYVSIACRQHDMVLLDEKGEPLIPAIMWRCKAAEEEVAVLRKTGVEETVGAIAPRFVLPKLLCVLNRQPSLRDKIQTVFMTGDWVTMKLTGKRTMSASDALSNGLLTQEGRRRADDVLEKAGFKLCWFPNVVNTGRCVGTVAGANDSANGPWGAICKKLADWKLVAGLGDNHASAVGCGMTNDFKKLVVSAGTSGTVNLSCPEDAKLPDGSKALQFEFYRDTLLLSMLGDCCNWYDRFVAQVAPEYAKSLGDLNALAVASDPSAIRRVMHDDEEHAERYPLCWPSMSLGEKVAGTQFSIVFELLLLVKRTLAESKAAGLSPPDTYVLTGGLSQSMLFQQVFHAGITMLDPTAAIKVSGRTGPLRYKTSAYGALVTAEIAALAGDVQKVKGVIPPVSDELKAFHAAADRFPLIDCASPGLVLAANLDYLLKSYRLDSC